MRRGLAWLGLLLVLGVLNGIVWQRERLISEGRSVLLELAPVDPRSLMQGDYMRLGYDLGDVEPTSEASGRVVMALDARGVARFKRYDNGTPLAPDEIAMQYQGSGRGLQVAPDAWFFQEGQADRFAAARYARVLVTSDGRVSLVALLDKKFRDL